MIKSTYQTTNITRVKKEVDTLHESCKNAFAVISSETGFFESNQKILEWISRENPHEAHRLLRNDTKIDAEYASCGEWLLDLERFKQWDDFEGIQIFWLCGTGKSRIHAHNKLSR